MRTLRRLEADQKPQIGHINQFVAALREVDRRLASLEGKAAAGEPAYLRCWAYNATGEDLRMGDAAAVSGATNPTAQDIIGPGAILELAAFDAEGLPDPPQWVVAAEAIPSGGGGWVYVAGVCMARATGSGACVAPPDSGAVLERGASGVPVLQACNATVAGSGETWVLIRLGLPPGEGGGGGTVNLSGSTDDLDEDEDGIYSDQTTLATITIPANGDYLVEGAISADTTGCSDLQGTICVDGVQVFQSYASATSGGNTHVALPAYRLTLTANQVITLKGYAYNASPSGVGALGKGENGPAKCWLTVTGPLSMAVS